VSDKPTPLQDRLGSMVHAFSDEQRKYAVRLLATDVGKVERELNAAQQRIKRLEKAGDAMADRLQQSDYLADCALADKWTAAKEAKP